MLCVLVDHGILHNLVTFAHLKNTFPDLNKSGHGNMAFVVFRRYCVHEGGPGLTEAFFGMKLLLMITFPSMFSGLRACIVACARSMHGMRPELTGIRFLVKVAPSDPWTWQLCIRAVCRSAALTWLDWWNLTWRCDHAGDDGTPCTVYVGRQVTH